MLLPYALAHTWVCGLKNMFPLHMWFTLPKAVKYNWKLCFQLILLFRLDSIEMQKLAVCKARSPVKPLFPISAHRRRLVHAPTAPVTTDWPGGLIGAHFFKRARTTQDSLSKKKKKIKNLLEGYQGIPWTSETERRGRPYTRTRPLDPEPRDQECTPCSPFPRDLRLSPLCMFLYLCFSYRSLKYSFLFCVCLAPSPKINRQFLSSEPRRDA